MGKVKFRKLKKLRHNPVDLPSNEDVSCAMISTESSQLEKQLPVISQVNRNASRARRSWVFMN